MMIQQNSINQLKIYKKLNLKEIRVKQIIINSPVNIATMPSNIRILNKIVEDIQLLSLSMNRIRECVKEIESQLNIINLSPLNYYYQNYQAIGPVYILLSYIATYNKLLNQNQLKQMLMSQIYNPYSIQLESIQAGNINAIPQYQAINQYFGYSNNIDNMMQNYSSKTNVNKSKVKTSLCKKWAQTGNCPYGYKCQFAHGLQQLRCNVDENSYKTKPCNAFFKKGYCQYGNRCNFSHKQSHNINTETEQKTEKIKKNKLVGYQQVLKQGLIGREGCSRLKKMMNFNSEIYDEKSENSTQDCKSDSLSFSRSSIQIRNQTQQFQNILVNGNYVYNSCGAQWFSVPFAGYNLEQNCSNQDNELKFLHQHSQNSMMRNIQ